MRKYFLGIALAFMVTSEAEGQSVAPAGWLRSDDKGQAVDLDLVVTRPGGSPSALINGKANGAAQVVVPRGWSVRWHWVNEDSSAHSLVVMAEREKLPTEGGRAVFTNAMTRAATAGLPTGATDQTTFVAEDGGWYWILCGVPGHAIAGEYIGLRVDPAATSGAVNLK